MVWKVEALVKRTAGEGRKMGCSWQLPTNQWICCCREIQNMSEAQNHRVFGWKRGALSSRVLRNNNIDAACAHTQKASEWIVNSVRIPRERARECHAQLYRRTRCRLPLVDSMRQRPTAPLPDYPVFPVGRKKSIKKRIEERFRSALHTRRRLNR